MELYKFIDSTTIQKLNNNYIETDGNIIANPLLRQLNELGYKELVKEEYPATEEGYYREFYYEDGEVITLKWSEQIKSNEIE